MSRKAIIVLLIFFGVFLFAVYKLIAGSRGNIAGLKVQSTPAASVYLDDELIGKTPYDQKHPPGEYVLKLIADENESSAVPWQGKVVLNPQVLTFVRREMGLSEVVSAGEIVTMEKISGGETQIAVFSSPDAAAVLLDGIDRGVTPLNLTISPGEHDVTVTSTGFIGRTVRVKTVESYKVTVNFNLAVAGDIVLPATPTPTDEAGATTAPEDEDGEPSDSGNFVTINDTPTGFLRVRFDATTSASEVARLNPGVKVPFIEEKSGWFKVEYETGKEGWISSRYAERTN
ncbi:MAG: WD40-domain containing protein [Candidatus Gottesmanbacteria bacterium GW2011_GWA2_43_14]|uniref:WD40-domain containing protein n=1 Tax=Candidatus Gottesmanbacteria bacterium GW2011_GWA2_43_14 TaxID=1618443 RepID=A0A0G1DKN0_9BACT|nr:MAG: WD40-domain containing protein [Candidatus Gottesmanbacteria bacterium GW2011_GWA2_43_14]